VPFPVSEMHIEREEADLGVLLPIELRNRLRQGNGGEVKVDGEVFYLHRVWDPTDRRRMKRSANHMLRETITARKLTGFPPGAVSLAVNNYGDRLIVRPLRETIEGWSREDGSIFAVSVDWYPDANDSESEWDDADNPAALQANDLVELQALATVASAKNRTTAQRLAYFFDEVREKREVWTLGNEEGWATKANDEGRIYISLWPQARFAAVCAVGLWSGTEPESIPLSTWIEEMTDEFTARNYKICVFPMPGDSGATIEPQAFREELRRATL